MAKIYLLLILLFLSFNIAYNQQDTISSIKLGHKVSEYPPLYIFDGLKIDQDKFIELKIDKSCIKRIKIDENYSFSDNTKAYKGSITIYSKMLVVLNDKLFFNSKDKKAMLSQVKQEEISLITALSKEEAHKKYGKAGKNGALIIKTKN